MHEHTSCLLVPPGTDSTEGWDMRMALGGPRSAHQGPRAQHGCLQHIAKAPPSRAPRSEGTAEDGGDSWEGGTGLKKDLSGKAFWARLFSRVTTELQP